MELNRIYRHYGIPTAQAYARFKEYFEEAFTGFSGVSFETIEATEDSTESFLIYLNSEKSLHLKLYSSKFQNSTSSYPRISINFRNEDPVNIAEINSSAAYRRFNIARTKYGVAFSGIGGATDATDILDDKYFYCFFTVGTPNVFIYSPADLISSTNPKNYYLYSELHELAEHFNQQSSLVNSAVPRTVVCNATSLVYPIECEYLYRKIYTEDKNGKIMVKDIPLIAGTVYALEYDPADDGEEA